MPTTFARPRPLRTRMRSILIGLITLGMVAACGAVGSSEERGTSGKTIDFSYEGYEATLPADPQRVVVLDSRSGLEFALLAGYPIAATVYGRNSPLSPLVSDSTARLKNSAFDLNREEIASHNPDLLVVGIGWYNYYKSKDFALEQIAPVLAVNDGIDVAGASADDPFRAMTDQLSRVNRTEKAESAIADYNTAVREANDKIGRYTTGKVASVIHSPVDNFTVVSEDSIYQVVLPALGMKILDTEQIRNAPPNSQGQGHMFSYENAAAVLRDADIVFVYKANAGADLDPLLARVPAIEAGRWIDGNLAQRFGFALTYTSFVNDIVASVQKFDDFSSGPA